MNHPTITSEVINQFVLAVSSSKPTAAGIAQEICAKHIETIDAIVTSKRKLISLRSDKIITSFALQLIRESLVASPAFASDYAQLKSC